MLNFLQTLKVEHLKYNAYDEATTKQTIILPILQKLGWNIFNSDEVCPEYGIAGKRVDYALRYGEKNLFFIEVKKCSIALEAHHEQLLNYAFLEGVSLACLTNGIRWQFFLPLREGNWSNRLFCTVDLKKQNAQELTEVFSKILSKTAVITKEALRWSKELHQSKAQDDAIASGLPEAWEALLREPTPTFVEAIAAKTENVCGYRPTSEQIIHFIASASKPASDPLPQAPPITPPPFPEEETPKGYYVNIRGVQIPTERIGSETERYFSTVLPLLLPLLPPKELSNLQSIDFCQRELNLGKQYPLLSKNQAHMQEPATGRLRAWKNPIAGFWVNAQWNEITNLPKWKLYLLRLERELSPPSGS